MKPESWLGKPLPNHAVPGKFASHASGECVLPQLDEFSFPCDECANIHNPPQCLPRGWLTSTEPKPFPMDRILQLRKKLESDFRSSKSANPFLTSTAVKAEMKAIVDSYVKSFLIWLDSDRCFQCVANRELMETWVKQDVAGWTVPGGNAFFANYFDPKNTAQAVGVAKDLPVAPMSGLLVPPVEIAKDPLDWLPSAMYPGGDIMVSQTSSFVPKNLGVGATLVGIKRSPLLSGVLATRAWRSLPVASDRRFWARLFGDVCGCLMNCVSGYGMQFGNIGTEFTYGDVLGPPIPYFFGLPPISGNYSEFGKPGYCGAGSVNVSPNYGDGTTLAKYRPYPFDSGTYSTFNLYVIAVPVTYNATGLPLVAEDPLCQSPPKMSTPENPYPDKPPCTCWLIRPTTAVSPLGEKENDWASLANAEKVKWQGCGSCYWPPPIMTWTSP